jgi:hypothetical protein
MKQRTVSSLKDVVELEASIEAAASAAVEILSTQPSALPPLAFLARAKFDQIGFDPLDPTRPLNIVEQLNQAFTYWATCLALRWLLENRTTAGPFAVNLGTAKGHDIVSHDGKLVAEVFAATRPSSNDKLRKDAQRLSSASANEALLFYLSPVAAQQLPATNVLIVRLPFPGTWLVPKAEA